MPTDLPSFMDDLSTWAKARLDEYVAASKVTAGKVVDGAYSAEEMTADLNAAWQRWADDVKSFLEILPVDLTGGAGGGATTAKGTGSRTKKQ